MAETGDNRCPLQKTERKYLIMKTLTRILMIVVVFVLVAGIALAAQPADLERWLEECMKIRAADLQSHQRRAQYTEAAEKGNTVAPVLLERMSRGENPPLKDAEQWTKMNRDNKIVTVLQGSPGDARAQLLLSDIYFNGLCGVAVDNKQAMEWLRKAAEQGQPIAQNNLGGRYEDGIIIPKDMAQAAYWYRKSAEQGNNFAKNNLDRIEKPTQQQATPTAQEKSMELRGKNDQVLVNVFADGTVRNTLHVRIGKFESDGKMRDTVNVSIGRIEANGTIRDKQDKRIGKIEADGTVRDEQDRRMGKIESDGTIRDTLNVRIGRAPGMKKEWAAAIYFFGFFNK